MFRMLAVFLLLAVLAVFFEGEFPPLSLHSTHCPIYNGVDFRGRRQLLLQGVRAAGDRLRLAQVVQGLLLPDRPRPLSTREPQWKARRKGERDG